MNQETRLKIKDSLRRQYYTNACIVLKQGYKAMMENDPKSKMLLKRSDSLFKQGAEIET